MREPLPVVVPIMPFAAGSAAAFRLTGTEPRVEPELPAEGAWTGDIAPYGLTDIRPEDRLFREIFAACQIRLHALVTGQVVGPRSNRWDGGPVRRGGLSDCDRPTAISSAAIAPCPRVAPR